MVTFLSPLNSFLFLLEYYLVSLFQREFLDGKLSNICIPENSCVLPLHFDGNLAGYRILDGTLLSFSN
jgi:hypothetical protein